MRRAGWAIRCVALAAIALLASATHAQIDDTPDTLRELTFRISISGRLLPWVMTVEFPWVGGNYYQLDEIVRGGELGDLEQVTKDMRDSVRDHDAGTMHVYDLMDYARDPRALPKYTGVIVTLLDKDLGPLFRENIADTWDKFFTVFVEPDVPSGSTTDLLITVEPMRVDGLPAYEGMFHIKGVPEGDWCRAMIVVPLGKRGTHLFVLTASLSRCEQRYEELKVMLGRLRYDPRLVREVTDAAK
jgi:hypothetical protein